MNSLLVGVGISDRAAPEDDPVADAVTAEALGYDFVSAFDHPVADTAIAKAVGYGAVPANGHLEGSYPTYETQTLLTWIAAPELGFTGFDLMPSRDQMRAIAEDVAPALRELRTPSQQAQRGRGDSLRQPDEYGDHRVRTRI